MRHKMEDGKRFMVDVGMRDLPFPMKVTSRAHPDGQFTIANISISARIMREFEVRWIDQFVRVLHLHRDRIGTEAIADNVLDYQKELKATTAKRIVTPVSRGNRVKGRVSRPKRYFFLNAFFSSMPL